MLSRFDRASRVADGSGVQELLKDLTIGHIGPTCRSRSNENWWTLRTSDWQCFVHDGLRAHSQKRDAKFRAKQL